MKRDFDLIRNIILCVDGKNKFPNDKTLFHLLLLGESGLISLTQEGKEFASLCIDETKWQKAKNKLQDAGFGLSYCLLMDILRSYS